MCYINGVRVTLAEFIEYKNQQRALAELNKIQMFKPIRKGFDYSDWPVIKPVYDGTNKNWDLVEMEWGFIPSWASLKTRGDVEKFRKGYVDANGKYQIGYTTLNAIGEEMFEKPMFAEAAMQRRCLIISTGFFEHRHVKVMGKRGKLLATPEKFPYHITVKDRPYFFFAGIYNPWTDKETGETVDTFAIITTEAEGVMRQIHNSKNRMPVILSGDMAEEWTNDDLSKERIEKLARFKIDPNLFVAHTVQKDFLDIDDPTCPCKFAEVEELYYED